MIQESKKKNPKSSAGSGSDPETVAAQTTPWYNKNKNKNKPSVPTSPIVVAQEGKPQAPKRGFYGVVDFVENNQGKWARKTLKNPDPAGFLREAFVGMALPLHENLIHFHEIQSSASAENPKKRARLSFIMPQAEATLNEKMPHLHDLTFLQFVSLVHQLFCAVNVLHQAGLLHLDIKPANILVMSWPKTQSEDDLPQIKLIDYGLALPRIPLNDLLANELITAWYRPPDFLCRSGIGFRSAYHLSNKADIFSAGMTTLELLCYWLFPHTFPKPFYGRIRKQLQKKYGSINDTKVDKEVAQKWMELFEIPSESAFTWNYYCEYPLQDFKSSSVLKSVEKWISLFYDDSKMLMDQFETKPLVIQDTVKKFLIVLLPTLSFNPTLRPGANDIIERLNQPPFVKAPKKYQCSVLDHDIFNPRLNQEPFVWVRDNKQRRLLQDIYHTYKEDAKGQLNNVEAALRQLDIPESDLFLMMLVFLAFLLPRSDSVEERIRQEQSRPHFLKQISRIFQQLSRQAPRGQVRLRSNAEYSVASKESPKRIRIKYSQ